MIMVGDPAVEPRPSDGGVTSSGTGPGPVMPATGADPDGSASLTAVGVLRPAPKRMSGPRPSESDCQRTIVDAAATFGYRVLSIRPALNRRGDYRTPIQGDPGYPDLTLVHPVAGVHFVELKRWPNRLEPSQAHVGPGTARRRRPLASRLGARRTGPVLPVDRRLDPTMKRHCPTCCCSNDTDRPLVINVDAEFFPLVQLIDRAVWDERRKKEAA